MYGIVQDKAQVYLHPTRSMNFLIGILFDNIRVFGSCMAGKTISTTIQTNMYNDEYANIYIWILYGTSASTDVCSLFKK